MAQYVPIVPNDTEPLSGPVRHFWVGAAGSLALAFAEGPPVTFAAVPSGWFTLPGAPAVQVLATGTTAGSLIGAFE